MKLSHPSISDHPLCFESHILSLFIIINLCFSKVYQKKAQHTNFYKKNQQPKNKNKPLLNTSKNMKFLYLWYQLLYINLHKFSIAHRKQVVKFQKLHTLWSYVVAKSTTPLIVFRHSLTTQYWCTALKNFPLCVAKGKKCEITYQKIEQDADKHIAKIYTEQTYSI